MWSHHVRRQSVRVVEAVRRCVPDLRPHSAAPADAKFVSTRVVLDDEGDEATVIGNLTLNGVTKPVTLDVDFHGAGTNPYNKKPTIGFEAEGKIRRSDFGIAYGIPAVSDEVELEIHAAFEKQ